MATSKSEGKSNSSKAAAKPKSSGKAKSSKAAAKSKSSGKSKSSKAAAKPKSSGKPKSSKAAAKPKSSVNESDLLRIATFLLFDATVFHDSLSGAYSKVPPLRKAEAPYQAFLDESWKEILKIDYAPVFEIAREVLLSFPNNHNTDVLLKRIIDAATAVGASGILARHDFMGRIYHKLLLRTTGQFYATLYTSLPAAALLGQLLVREPHPNWNFASVDEIEDFRVIDAACGSGTLLSSLYTAIRDAYIFHSEEPLDFAGLHRALTQDTIHGWDVLDYAAHLTLTTLALHNNKTPIDHSNIFSLPVGIYDGNPHLGSLDQLRQQISLSGRGFGGTSAKQALSGARADEEVEAPEADIVAMNPPFSRSSNANVKFGFTTADDKKRLNAELSELAKELGHPGISRAGLTPYFMMLALQLAKPDGRIGLVVPRSTLSGVSTASVRHAYTDASEIRFIISNFDPGNTKEKIDGWSWSENTALGEVLIVAQKVPAEVAERTTICVNFWRQPRNEIEGLIASHEIARASASLEMTIEESYWEPISLGDLTVGAAYRVNQDRLDSNWLVPCLFASPELNELAIAAFYRQYNRVALKEIAVSLGRDIAEVKNHFKESNSPTATPLLWGHQGAMRRLQLDESFIGFGQPKKGAASTALHEKSASTVLLAERPHPSTEALIATSVPHNVLATAFWEIQLQDPEQVPAFLLWFNSTYGLLEYLSWSTSSQGDIFKAKKAQVEKMRLPDPKEVDLQAAIGLFDELKATDLLTVHEEFAAAAEGTGLRFAMDKFWRDQVPELPEIKPGQYRLFARDEVLTKIPRYEPL